MGRINSNLSSLLHVVKVRGDVPQDGSILWESVPTYGKPCCSPVFHIRCDTRFHIFLNVEN